MTVYIRFLANGHLAGSEKSRDSNHGLYGSRAWILDPDPALPPPSESSSPKAYSGSPQLLQQLVWLLLKTAAWEADPPGPGPLPHSADTMEADLPPDSLEPALGCGSAWTSALSAPGSPDT